MQIRVRILGSGPECSGNGPGFEPGGRRWNKVGSSPTRCANLIVIALIKRLNDRYNEHGPLAQLVEAIVLETMRSRFESGEGYQYAVLAQLAEATASKAVGSWFESERRHQTTLT